jgi:3-dehydroquinate synthase
LIISVDTHPAYPVHVGAGILESLVEATAGGGPTALLADLRAHELHANKLGRLNEAPCHRIGAGEASKCFAELERVLDFMARAGLDRRSTLFVFGGGVAGDLGGLAASLFKRGIEVVQMPTTLLAQVDASIGGKTAVNLAAGKNLAGTVHQPSAVFADVEMLATLPEAELRSGLGEVVKTALIEGEERLAELEADAAALIARDPEALTRTVAACVRIKGGVVAADPGEVDARRVLNLGHTFGHAIEHAAGYGVIPHGVAVAAGLVLSLEAAQATETLEDGGLLDRVRRLLTALGLPAGLSELRATGVKGLEADSLLAGIAQDKKGAVGDPRFVLPRRAGRIDLDRALPRDVLVDLLAG